MKIGILTFWWTEDNYGQILQCFALGEYLRSLGHEVSVIKYDGRNDLLPTPFPKRILKIFSIKILIKYIRKMFIKSYDVRDFESFKTTYLNFTPVLYKNFDSLISDPPEFDCYIVGSDQVWYFGDDINRNKKRLHAYFLDFGKKNVLRIAYAASWGKNSLQPKIEDEIRELIPAFQYVSVRETSGLNLCLQCGFPDPKLVVDPVMLLSPDVYRKLYKKKNTGEKDPYVFVYLLDNTCTISLHLLKKWADLNRLQIIYVTGNSRYDKFPKTFPAIEEWLQYIDNASFVVTNSFHCSVFSILFHKSYGIVPLRGKEFSSMNNRFYTLSNIAKSPDRFIEKNNFDVLKNAIDWDTVDTALNQHITFSHNFIVNSLGTVYE